MTFHSGGFGVFFTIYSPSYFTLQSNSIMPCNLLLDSTHFSFCWVSGNSPSHKILAIAGVLTSFAQPLVLRCSASDSLCCLHRSQHSTSHPEDQPALQAGTSKAFWAVVIWRQGPSFPARSKCVWCVTSKTSPVPHQQFMKNLSDLERKKNPFRA